MEFSAYSLKEKAHVKIQNPEFVIMKNGRKAVRGVSAAGNKVFKILSKDDAAKLSKKVKFVPNS